MSDELNLNAKVTLEDGTEKTYKKGVSYLDIAAELFPDKYKTFVGCKVNNSFAELKDILKVLILIVDK